jgi:hypothetical protein
VIGETDHPVRGQALQRAGAVQPDQPRDGDPAFGDDNLAAGARSLQPITEVRAEFGAC